MRLYRAAAAAGLTLVAQTAASTVFSSQVEEILSRPALSDASIGIEVRELESGEQIYKHDEDVALTPASNQKLLTSTVALSNLGSDFTFNTTVFGTSDVGKDGVLDGDVYIVGSGDPSLTSERLAELAEDLVSQTGLKEVTGKIYGDGTIFDKKFTGEDWSEADMSFYYSAQVSGLNCDLNVVSITVTPGDAAGDSPAISVNGLSAEEEQYVEIDSSVKTVAEGGTDNAGFERRLGTNTIVLTGSIPVDSDPVTFQVTIHDPTAFTAYRFALALEKAGVEVSTAPTESAEVPEDASELVSSTSKELSSLLANFLKPSDNMYGEALLKTIGRVATPDEPGSASTGTATVAAFLEGEDVDTTGVETVDGSGLSGLNKLTAQFLADLLSRNKKEFSEAEWKIYFDALPIGGVDGTIADRFVDSPVKGKVRAKTGTLTGVSSLSGYLEAGDGTEYVFSILMNGFEDATEAKGGQDDIVMALYDYEA